MARCRPLRVYGSHLLIRPVFCHVASLSVGAVTVRESSLDYWGNHV